MLLNELKDIKCSIFKNQMWKTYKLTCSESGKVYYGSTKLSLVERKGRHRNLKNCECKDFINPTIELMDVFETREKMLYGERLLIEDNDCVNIKIPIKTKKEITTYKDEWYQQNKKRISDKGKEIIKCECGMSIKKSSKWNHMKTKFHLNNVDN